MRPQVAWTRHGSLPARRRRYKVRRRGFKEMELESGNPMRFEVNGQMFFVNFIPEEGRWYCFAPTATGLQKIPVSIDASPFEAYTVELDEQAKEVVN